MRIQYFGIKMFLTFSGFDVKLNRTMDFQMLLKFALNQPKSAFIRSEKVLGCL